MGTQYFDTDDQRVWDAFAIIGANDAVLYDRKSWLAMKAQNNAEGMAWHEQTGEGHVAKLKAKLAKFKKDHGKNYRLKNSALAQ